MPSEYAKSKTSDEVYPQRMVALGVALRAIWLAIQLTYIYRISFSITQSNRFLIFLGLSTVITILLLVADDYFARVRNRWSPRLFWLALRIEIWRFIGGISSRYLGNEIHALRDYHYYFIENIISESTDSIGKIAEIVEMTPRSIDGGRPGKEPEYDISIAHPKKSAIGYQSIYLVSIQKTEQTKHVTTYILEDLKRAGEIKSGSLDNVVRLSDGINIQPLHVVTVELFCQDIDFSHAKTIFYQGDITTMSFTGRPKDTCHLGTQRCF